MSQITRHSVKGSQIDGLLVERADQLGPGGAPRRYDITGFDTATNPFAEGNGGYVAHFSRLPVIFQAGPVGEAGPNGISFEALLAIVEDGLEHYQKGPFACQENAIALVHVQTALNALHGRTRNRMKRAIEGQPEK